MKKVEVGDWFRNQNGLILKVDDEDFCKFFNSIDEETLAQCKYDYRLLYVLEEGDYINGSRITRKMGDYVFTEDDNVYDAYKNDPIKYVVTKEYFNNIKNYINLEEEDENGKV